MQLITAAATVAGVAKQRHRVEGETTARCHRAQSDGEVRALIFAPEFF